MHRKRSRSLIISCALTIVFLSVVSYSSQNISFEFARAKYSGTNQGTFSLKGSAYNSVKWNFFSTRPVDLIIIKEVTLQYFEKIEALYGVTFDRSEYYVSRGKYSDSGETRAETSETLIVQFETNGEISYSVMFDPVIIEFNSILYSIIGILFLIGLISVIFQSKKQTYRAPDLIVEHTSVKRTENVPQKTVITTPSQKQELIYAKDCDFCGAEVDLDAIFCHECGHPLKIFDA